MKVLAVEVPAPCALDCAFCRTPEHDVGDPKAVLEAVKSNLDGCDELYVTSNGETGRSSIFGDLLQIAKEKNIRVSVLCATAESVVPGLARVEVSMNKYTAPLAELAIARAREVGVPVVISMVDTGQPVDAVEIAEKYRVDGVLIRALQAEGRSKKVRGDTRVFHRDGSDLGASPCAVYPELDGQGFAATCIGPHGQVVPSLGGRYAHA